MSQLIGKTRLAYSRAWHHLSASPASSPAAATTTSQQLSLGRLASQISIILQGKHKPIYDPSTDCGDYVVATDCSDLLLTGKKWEQKKYYRHTTRPGSLKEISAERVREKFGGGEVLRRAVRGMLPKNRLRDDRMHRLKCFEGGAHPYKENVVKIRERPRIAESHEVRPTLERIPLTKSESVASPLTQ